MENHEEMMASISEMRESGQLEDYLKQVGEMNVLQEQEILDLMDNDDVEILATLYNYLQTVLDDMEELTEAEAALVDLSPVHENIKLLETHIEFVDEEGA